MQYIILSSFQDTLDGVALITPHSATLHVGLKSLALSGHPKISSTGTVSCLSITKLIRP
ncbi:hypothetical protein Barb4_01944 [Bacteroidales bacterium Barb4]|nr:hypothetical protein Barb4_01944 [Bacteroidales bacterium Barb4]